MHIGPLRILAVTALLLCFASEASAADTGRYRTAAGWTNSTHRSASGLHARRIPGGRHVVRGGPYGRGRALYNASRPLQWRPVPSMLPFDAPGATVITRQDLDALNATSLRGALRYAPGVIVK
jgi:hypothetical protein